MEEINLKMILQIFWSKKIEIVCIMIIFAIIGTIYTMFFVTPVYSSSTSIILASSNNTAKTADISSTTATELTVNSKLVSTYSELVESKNVLRKVISNLNINIDEEILKKNVRVNAIKDTELIEITVTNENAREAARIANEIAVVFMEKVKEIYKIENVQVIDEAEPDEKPSNVNIKKSAAMFTGIGLVVAVIYVLIANMLDTTIKKEEDIEETYGLPVLVSIPICEDNAQKSKKGGKK